MTTTGYYDYGGGSEHVTVDKLGNAIGNVVITAWTARSGGAKVTNLLDRDGHLLTDGNIISDTGATNEFDIGRYQFQAPDTYGVLYLDRGYGDRWPIFPQQISTAVGDAISKADQAYAAYTTMQPQVDSIEASQGNISTHLNDIDAELASQQQIQSVGADTDGVPYFNPEGVSASDPHPQPSTARLVRQSDLADYLDVDTADARYAPAGSTGAGSAAVEVLQPDLAATWTVTVPAGFGGRRPSVDVYVGDEKWITDVTATPTTVTVLFATPQVGSVVLT